MAPAARVAFDSFTRAFYSVHWVRCPVLPTMLLILCTPVMFLITPPRVSLASYPLCCSCRCSQGYQLLLPVHGFAMAILVAP